MRPDLQEEVLYVHHFNTQILPPLDSYINEQSMHVCMIANSSSVLCFLRLLSEAFQMSTSARTVFNWLCWLLTISYWAVSCHTTG